MSQPTNVAQSDFQRLIVEQALAYAQQLEQAAGSAPPGQTLDSCEGVVLGQGRQFLLDSLAAAVQQHIHESEKKGLPPVPVLAVRCAVTRALIPVK
jgi:hypothetical protein